MISTLTTDLLKRRMVVMKILWAAITMSILILVFVTFQIKPPTQTPPVLELNIPFVAIAVLVSFLSFALRRWTYLPKRFQSCFGKTHKPEDFAQNPQTGQIDENRLQEIKRVPEGELSFLSLPGPIFVPFILSLVLSEALTLCGFVMSNSAHEPSLIIPYAVTGLVLNLFHFPTLSKIVEAGEQARAAHQGEKTGLKFR